jgi:uncharacterized protein CbrC (UPF0167 family)
MRRGQPRGAARHAPWHHTLVLVWRRKRTREVPTGTDAAPPLPEFPYHPDPWRTGVIEPSKRHCISCGEAPGLLYTGPVFSVHREILVDAVCPWCIADGTAAERFEATFTGVGDELPGDVPGEVVAAVTQRTPGFSGWQQEHWLYHCGDGAAFVGTTEAAGETAYRFRCRHCGTGLAYSDSP